MEFYDEYFDFGPKAYFGLRFNSIGKDGMISSPVVKNLFPNKTTWEKGKKGVSDDTGLFYVSTEQLDCEIPKGFQVALLYADTFRESNVLYVIEVPAQIYNEEILVQNLFTHNKEMVNKYLVESNTDKMNILSDNCTLQNVPNIIYERCREKQIKYYGKVFNYFPKEASDFVPEIETIANICSNFLRGLHGIRHSKHVEAFGLLSGSDVDMLVVRTFAYLHDCCRENDGDDVNHGPRAADFIENWRTTCLSYLDDTQFGKLQDAIRYHTTEKRTNDDTINACFDADRLDIGRCGMKLDPDKMASTLGWFHAKFGLTKDEEQKVLLFTKNMLRTSYYMKKIQNWHNGIVEQMNR